MHYKTRAKKLSLFTRVGYAQSKHASSKCLQKKFYMHYPNTGPLGVLDSSCKDYFIH